MRIVFVLILYSFFGIGPVYSELSGSPCLEPEYVGWRCHEFVLPRIAGTEFEVRIRWNRPGLFNWATVIWLAGGNGSKPHSQIDFGVAGAADPRPIRHRLDQDQQIRSIEIQFLNPVDAGAETGGYWAPPRMGYLKAAQAYQQIIVYLQQPEVELIQGDWFTQVGSSNGATVLAFTLAYLQADRYSTRIILVSGPFIVDILRECRDSSFIAYTGINDSVAAAVPGHEIRRLISVWNGWQDCAALTSVEPQRALLGDLAQQDFPETEIAVVMGAADPFAPWILRSNEYWYDAINAYSQQRIVVDNVSHDVFASNADTDALLFQLISEMPQLDRIWFDGFEP